MASTARRAGLCSRAWRRRAIKRTNQELPRTMLWQKVKRYPPDRPGRHRGPMGRPVAPRAAQAPPTLSYYRVQERLDLKPQPPTPTISPEIFPLHCTTIDTQNASNPLTDEPPRGILDSRAASTPHRDTTWTCRTLPTSTSSSTSELDASCTPPHGPTETEHAG